MYTQTTKCQFTCNSTCAGYIHTTVHSIKYTVVVACKLRPGVYQQMPTFLCDLLSTKLNVGTLIPENQEEFTYSPMAGVWIIFWEPPSKIRMVGSSS